MSRVYVGNLPRDVQTREIEDLFYRFGRLEDIHIKNGYAFVSFADARDAEDAVRSRDGTDFDGRPLRWVPGLPPPRDGGKEDHRRGRLKLVFCFRCVCVCVCVYVCVSLSLFPPPHTRHGLAPSPSSSTVYCAPSCARPPLPLTTAGLRVFLLSFFSSAFRGVPWRSVSFA